MILKKRETSTILRKGCSRNRESEKGEAEKVAGTKYRYSVPDTFVFPLAISFETPFHRGYNQPRTKYSRSS